MRRMRQGGKRLCAALLACALLLAPLVNSASHGPADYVEAVLTLAHDIAHGHSHDHGDGGNAAHDALDHDHQSAALLPPDAGGAETAPPETAVAGIYRASGRPQDGLRRPPRQAA